MRKLVLFLFLPVSCFSATTFPPNNGNKNFFTTNQLTDVIDQTNTLVLSGFHLTQKTNDISGANGIYTWNGTKYVFNVTNTVSFVGSVSAWCLTNGMTQIAPAVNPVIAADISQTATVTPESVYWFDNAGLILGRSLFTRASTQTADGVYVKNQSGNTTNLTLWYNTILGADSTGIRWSGGGNNNGSGTDLIPLLNPILDGGQRILYFGGNVSAALEGQLEAMSFQVNRTNSSATLHGLLCPRITFAFNNPNGGQYSSWRFEMFDLTANNATETGGGGQSLINVSPAGSAPTNVNFGGPEWTNTLRGVTFQFVTTNAPESINGYISTRSNLVAPTSITFPNTTVNWTNPVHCNIQVYINNVGVTASAFKKNGTTIFTSTVSDMTIGLQPGEYFSETYTVGTPSATWSPF